MPRRRRSSSRPSTSPSDRPPVAPVSGDADATRGAVQDATPVDDAPDAAPDSPRSPSGSSARTGKPAAQRSGSATPAGAKFAGAKPAREKAAPPKAPTAKADKRQKASRATPSQRQAPRPSAGDIPGKPDAALMEDFKRQVVATIEEHGWIVITTWADLPEGRLAFAYTVGLTETFGHPELTMSGLGPRVLHQLLNDVGKVVREGRAFADGAHYSMLVRDYDVIFRRVRPNARATRFSVANWRYGRDGYEMLQIVYPDAAGVFPWESTFDPALRAMQPVLWAPDEPLAS